MMTHAPLRSRRTKAQSVSHVQGLGDGDFPTSPLKDTRLFHLHGIKILGMLSIYNGPDKNQAAIAPYVLSSS